MSYNGSGTFQINTSGQPVVAGTVISSTAFNALTADLATGLSTAITKDGQTATTVRIPFAQGISSTLVTDSSSVSTGSIITAGGVGIAKALYVGTTANIAGVTTLTAQPILSSLTASKPVFTDASKGLVSTGTLGADQGGTGVANNAAMTVTGSGNFAYTRTLTGTTNVTFPTTGTLLSTADVATQANQETATSTTTLVTPGRQQFHPSAAKVWCRWQPNGTLDAGFNVTSITDTGIGVWVVNFSTAFSNVNYAAFVCAGSSNVDLGQVYISGTGQAVGSCTTLSSDAGAVSDPSSHMMFVAFGDQ